MQMSKWIGSFRWSIALVIALCLGWVIAPQGAWACGGGVICVDASAAGAATGLSWTDAYTSVVTALNWTNVHSNTVYEIWVAEGVYYPWTAPNPTQNRYGAFVIDHDNVRLYGGFAGNESTRDQRNWRAHPTVLSGDIDANDWNTDTNAIAETWNDIVGDNAYHVLYLQGGETPISKNTVIDGFIVTAGLADADPAHTPQDSGGGLYCGTRACSPTLTNVIFSGNRGGWGGGMFALGWEGVSNPTLMNVTFSGNRASFGGGGMASLSFLAGGESNPVLTNTLFVGNQADDGGGMYNNGSDHAASNPTLTNVVFSGNRAKKGGGMYNLGSDGNGVSNPVLVNVTFGGNQADQYGGAIYNMGYSGSSNPNMINGIMWGNAATVGPQLHNEGDATFMAHYSDIEWAGGVYTGTDNLNVNPQFVAPSAAGNAPTTAGNYRLTATSQAANAGNNGSVSAATDLDGKARIYGGVVDMGAYEVFQGTERLYLPTVLRSVP